MSCFTVEVLPPSGKIIEIETCAGNAVSSITIENYSTPNIELGQCISQLPADLNDRVFAIVSGDIVASTGMNIVSSGGKIYLNSLLNSGNGISLSYSSGLYTIATTGLQPSGNYSIVGHQHLISDISGLQTELDNKQPSGSYANSIHNHVSSDITNFDNSVSGLLPSVSGYQYIDVVFSNNTYTIQANGLQPSGNYSTVGHGHNISDINNLQSVLDNKQPSGSYASGIHYHLSSDITNFNNSVSGLLPSVSGGSYAQVILNNNVYTVSVTGLQPSGNYSIVSHTHNIVDVSGLQTSLDSKQPSGFYASGIHYHSASDITDFSTSVSGLISQYALLYSPSFSGIPTAPTAASGTNNTQIASTAFVRTEISNLVNSAPTTLDTLNELANALGDDPNFATTVASGIGSKANIIHNHVSSDITNFDSSVSGLIPVKNIVSGTGINISSNSGIYTITATGSGVLADQASALVTTVFNKTGSPIPKMTAVYINGGQGDMPTVSLGIATGDTTSAGTYGVTYETIPNMQPGKVIVFGALTGLDTDQFNPTAPQGDVNGTILYLSPTTSGALTTTKPQAPNHIVTIATIVRTHKNEGVIEVRIQNGFELEELHNVAISGVTNGQFLQYDGNSSLWIPSSSGNFNSLTINGSGISLNGHNHTSSNITDFNTTVSGLLPVKDISGSSYVNVSNSSGNYAISVTGLQPSGSYANLSHTHTASNITDINLIPVSGLGSISGTYSINAGFNNSIQTMTLNGFATTFTKGSGWPSNNTSATDVVLKLTASSATSITWTLVTDWFTQPSAGALESGVHLFLLRGVGSGVVEGHYIGKKTN